MRRLIIGVLAHVDAGKTTLAESILFKTGSIRKIGRVDHKNAFLDTHNLERDRGITIFSKQAVFLLKDLEITLLDTPGHVDFSAEMERTLQVLDYAILIISGSDGIQGHTETLWKLLKEYKIPTFIFVNKMDLDGTNSKALISDMKKRFHDGCVDFGIEQEQEVWLENLAMTDESLLEKYMDTQMIETEHIKSLISARKIFPCYFGSALKLQGVEELLNGIDKYTIQPSYTENFGAKIYKIARDEQGNRLTYMKITGGSLRVKMLLSNSKEGDEASKWEEKVDQIRIYSGNRYESVDEVGAGSLCAVMGLNSTYPGEGLGIEVVSNKSILEPILNYQILLPPDIDANVMITKLRLLEEEDPQLHIVWSEELKVIHAQLMGEVQVEILKSLILQRFGIKVEFGPGNIVYKETIIEPVEGVGHYEPLRHYAEVHVLLEPGEKGSGITYASTCSEDILDRNWQRLILTHMEEKEHIGVLTGSPITDMKITLLTGRRHQKHTEGGDFRQATYRAIRHGLKKGKTILLEPYYNFRLEIPTESVGRAMSDIGRMVGEFDPPHIQGEMSVITGYAPVATMNDYQLEVHSYTSGRGRLFCTLRGYEQCHNADQVIEEVGYDSERDVNNPTSSIFCANGAGYVVEWDKVVEHMHVESGWSPEKLEDKKDLNKVDVITKSRASIQDSIQMDKELEDIFVRTFGPIKQKYNPGQSLLGQEKRNTSTSYEKRKDREPIQEYLLVDGYNIVFSWEELSELAKENLDAARYKLMDILCNYQALKKCIVILVFDAYKVKGGVGEVLDYHNIHVVYTKEAETADAYIEKTVHEISRKHHVTVATSDALEQLIIMGQGAARLSANDLKDEVNRTLKQMRHDYMNKPLKRNYIGDEFTDKLMEYMEKEEL